MQFSEDNYINKIQDLRKMIEGKNMGGKFGEKKHVIRLSLSGLTQH